ncbi:MAG: DUF3553 domain-containing protein, partial [Bacteroidetes bacterium]|nr:DUF3553 domain-containing protein [Bacteroidota bacterium]
DERYLARPQIIRREAGRTAASRREPVKQNVRISPRTAVSSENTDFTPAKPEEIIAGIRVKHQKFGTGKVLAVEGSSTGKKATVFFDGKGKKVLLLKYAKLQIV